MAQGIRQRQNQAIWLTAFIFHVGDKKMSCDYAVDLKPMYGGMLDRVGPTKKQESCRDANL